MKKFYLIIFLVTLSVTSYAQRKTVEFKNGNKVSYDLNQNHTDQMNRFNLHLSLLTIRATYFQPDMFYANASASIMGYGIDALIFTHSHERTIQKKISLDAKKTGYKSYDVYVDKADLVRKTYYGVHTGYRKLAYDLYSGAAGESFFNVPEIAVGVGMMRGLFFKGMIDNGRRPQVKKGTTQIGLTADLTFYPTAKALSTPPTAETNSRPTTALGARLMAEGKMSMSARRDWGLSFQGGVIYNVYKAMYPLGSLGIYMGF